MTPTAYHPSKRSVKRWVALFSACACSTNWTILASVLSWCRRSTRTWMAPWLLIVPAKQVSPTRLATGIDSPVIADWSIAVSPASTQPSTATRSPGRTSTTSPSRSSSMGTTRSWPSRRTVATSGESSISARTARWVRPRAWCSSALEVEKSPSRIAPSSQ